MMCEQTAAQSDGIPRNSKGERMLRVLVLGGSSSEAKILKRLSDMVSVRAAVLTLQVAVPA